MFNEALEQPSLEKAAFNSENDLIENNNLNAGSIVPLKLTPKTTKRKNGTVWVYAGTDVEYKDVVPTEQLTNTTINKKKGLVHKGDLTLNDGSTITLELISKNAQNKRKAVRSKRNKLEIDELIQEANTQTSFKQNQTRLSPTQLFHQMQNEDELIGNSRQGLPSMQDGDNFIAHSTQWSPLLFQPAASINHPNSDPLKSPKEDNFFMELDDQTKWF